MTKKNARSYMPKVNPQTKRHWRVGWWVGDGLPLQKPCGRAHTPRTHRGDVLGIYAGAGGSIGELGTGIAHAASWAYKKLGDKKLLKPGSSVVLPLVFKDTFLPLMKALLLSRVIAKAPLSNANDICGLRRAKDAFETKGYGGEDLVKLLIITHRLWTPNHGAVRPQHSTQLGSISSPPPHSCVCVCARVYISPRWSRGCVSRS